jgi:DNA modification methylase
MTMKDRVKELRRVPASELRANPKNWRRHPPSQEAALRGVLEDIGFADAVIARETDDGLELIDGHLRQEVMGDQVVPVLIVDVTAEEADKMLLTYDPLAIMAHADQDQLLHLLRDTQFESKAINDMLEAVANGERLPMPDLTEPVDDPGPQIDRADELREKWQTERGQVWEVGRHRLMCGDCTSPEDVGGVLLAGEKPGLMVTDPPYGIDYDPAWRVKAAQEGHLAYEATRIGEVRNDDRADWKQAWDCFPGDVLYAWHPPGATSLVHARAIQDSGFMLRAQIIWAKSHFPIGRGDYHLRHEPCWYAVRQGQAAHRTKDRTQTTLWQINLDKNVEGGHSTQKPVECMARAIRNHTFPDVYDPFLGSGTTMVAAEQLGRICYGMEIEPKYVAVTLERMSGMGLEPKLAGK